MASKEDSLSRMSLSPAQVGDFAGAISTLGVLPPREEWTEQTRQYERWWAFYSGDVLTQVEPGTQTPISPLEVNFARTHANLHALLTFGALPTEQLFRVYAEPYQQKRSNEGPLEERWLGRLVEAAIKENEWGELLPEASRIFQALGGVYFKVVHDQTLVNGVRIELLPPNCVFPIWDKSRQMREVWVLFWINREEALSYGLRTNAERALYAEHWTAEKWEVFVAEEGQSLVQARVEGVALSGTNPYRVGDEQKATIPFFYAPRLRTIGNYGVSIIDSVIGLIREFNERSADIGDALREASMRHRYATNWRGDRNQDGKIVVNPARNEIVDAGSTPAGQENPEIIALDPPPFSAVYLDFLSVLRDLLHDSTFTAPVMLGRDEGSQRSGETLAARALPTVTAISYYRTSFAAAINRIGVQALRCMNLLSLNEVKAEEVRSCRFNVDWWPILPRERRELVENETLLYTSGLRSLEMSVFQLGDVRNTQEEVDRINKAHAEKFAREVELAQSNKPAPGQSSPPPKGAGASSRRPASQS